MITSLPVDPLGSSGPYGGDVPQVPGPGDAFGVLVPLFVLVFVGVAVFAVVSAVRNYSAARRGGLDPMTAETDLAVALKRKLDSDVRAQAASPVVKSLEERLAELDDLAARGVVTDAERADARARLLGGPAA